MNIIFENGTVVISLGLLGILLLFYIFIEVMTIRYKNMSFLHGLIIYSIYLKRLQKQIPPGWQNKTKIYDFGSLSNSYGAIYSIVQHLDCDIDNKRVYTFVYINWRGQIIKNELKEICEQHESIIEPNLLKSYKREISLKELGIED